MYALYTYDCVPTYPPHTFIKYADNMTVVGLNSRVSIQRQRTEYKENVYHLTDWCTTNDLYLNTIKPK